MPNPSLARFVESLRAAVADGSLVKLTLGKHRGADATLKNLFVRPVALKAGPHLSLVWRHATRDITKNLPPAEALALIEPLLGADFRDAHLFTPLQTVQLECRDDGTARLSVKTATSAPPPAVATHDRARQHLIPADSAWLRALGVTNDRGQPREGMAHKFRQIQKFVELLDTLFAEAGLSAPTAADTAVAPLRLADMGSGKGYLTFAAAAHFGPRVNVRGVEARAELVELCNGHARAAGLDNLRFERGEIVTTEAAALDVLIALHACDTATDDAIAHGIAGGARLIVVSPCCQKELRPQLVAPSVLAPALRHGIFAERHAEFLTDALRALLLEHAGYATKVFEFISTEHTAKNTLIAAIRTGGGESARAREEAAARARALAAFYGVTRHHLAARLGFALGG